MGERNYRIEVLRGYWNPAIPFTARCYVREDVTGQPTSRRRPGGSHERRGAASSGSATTYRGLRATLQTARLPKALGFLEEWATKK